MNQTVHLVDDDADVRDALSGLLQAAGLRVQAYARAEDFLASCVAGQPGCLLLDVAMPGMTGPELQAALAASGIDLPVVFLTGHGDIPTAVRVTRAGAVDFLEKPVAGKVLVARVKNALELDAKRRLEGADRRAIRARYAQLSEREREVMALVVTGLSSKEIARRLGISHRTVEVHRTNLMHKMGAARLPDLIACAACCAASPGDFPPAEPDPR